MSELAVSTAPEQALTEVEILSGTEFFENLAADLCSTGPGSRVAILTMDFEPSEPLVKHLLGDLSSAANRGAEVLLGTDAFAFLIDDGANSIGPLFAPLPLRQSSYKRRHKALDELAQQPGASYGIINKPDRWLSNPYAGRSHIKLAVVNDKVYLGGPNLHRTERADIAVGLKGSVLANNLYELASTIIQTETTEFLEDSSLQIDDATKILIDSGQPNESVILDEALKLVDEAQERVWATFQFCPSGRVVDSLVEAHARGLDARVFYNHPSNLDLTVRLRNTITKARSRRQLPQDFKDVELPLGSAFIHGKALASEKDAIVGSHILVDLGVKFGTAEMSIVRQSAEFARAVGSLMLEQIYGPQANKSEVILPDLNPVRV